MIAECDQGSSEWKQIRLGVPSASKYADIITTRGEPSKSAKKYMHELAAERITGRPTNYYQSYAMKNGKINELKARKWYECFYDVEVRQIGFCFFDERKRFGASPDGWIGEDGGLEIKGAEPHIQIERLLYGWSPMDHWQQIQGNMLCSGRKWWKAMSYCENLDPIILHIERDDKFCAQLRVALESFCDELDAVTNKLRGLN
jgi:hypothetical protein